jgi:hypothetical protein
MRTESVPRLAIAASLLLGLAACGPAGEDPTEQSLAVKRSKSCLAAEPIDLGAGVATVHGDSSGTKIKTEPCGSGPAEYYTFTVSRLSALYVDTFGSSFDTVVGLLADGCSAPARSCAEDACGTPQTQLLEIVQPGTYRLLVAGRNAWDSGPYAVHLELVPIPSLPVGEIPHGPFDLTGAMTGYTGGRLGDCGRGPFVWYWYLSCPGESGYFTASTCNAETTFDAALSFVDVNDGEEVCCDDPDPEDAAEMCVGPGLEEFPGQAAIEVWDEPDGGLHILKVGATSVMRAPTTPYRIVGDRP